MILRFTPISLVLLLYVAGAGQYSYYFERLALNDLKLKSYYLAMELVDLDQQMGRLKKTPLFLNWKDVILFYN